MAALRRLLRRAGSGRSRRGARSGAGASRQRAGAGRAPPTAALPPHDPTVAPSGKLPHASPSVRKFARELGVPLEEVKGSGPKGRITQEDVQSFTKAVMSGAASTKAAAAKAPAGGGGGEALGLLPWPKVDFTKFGTVERKDLSRIKKISGANLHRNWVMIPHVTNNDEADITELEAFRVSTNKENEKSGVKVTMLAFVIKAVVAALKKFPEFNSQPRRRPAGLQAVLPHRLRGGHAQRPGGAGDQGRRQEGRAADQPGNGRARQEGARRQARPGRHAGRLLLDQLARRHRRHALHADHQRARSRDPGPVARAR